jgi:AraC family transcriptional regulator of adaptative response / DNA-3-methyladenine glycosylase II
MSPSRLREHVGAERTNGSLTLHLSYRPPFAWEAHLGFIEQRASAGVEEVDDGSYRRTVALGEHFGWIEVARNGDRNSLVVRAASTLAPVLQPLLARLRDLFDLHARPDVIDEHLAVDARLSRLVDKRRGLRVPGAFDGFELAWRAILGQQVSVRGASTLAGRFARRFGVKVETPFPNLTHLSPTPVTIVAARPKEIAKIGLPLARASSLHDLATLCLEEPALLRPGSLVQQTSARLLAITGLGPWTAAYIAMRALHWPDAFPETDLGIRHALGLKRPQDIVKASQPWRPWRAYAAMHLWMQRSENQP